MVSPGSGSWAYTTSPRASAAYLDMPTVPGNTHIYYGSPIHCDSLIDLFIFFSPCIPVGCPTQLLFSMCYDKYHKNRERCYVNSQPFI